MAEYAITYDLRKPGRDYSSLYDAIKACGNWAHPFESFWVVRSSLTVIQIRDRLVKCIDSNDGVYVGALTGEAAWFGIGDKVSHWLKAA